jgi:hypothetical protein
LRRLWNWFRSLFKRTETTATTTRTLDEIPLPGSRKIPEGISRLKDKIYQTVWNPGPAYPELQDDIMGGFIGDFQRLYYKDKKAAIKKWSRYFKHLRKLNYSRVKFFVTQNDPHPSNAYMFHISPFQRDDKGRFILNKHEPLWIESYRAWLKLMRKYKLLPLACHYMARYGFYPFRFNVNGCRGFYDPKAFKYQTRLSKRLLRIEKDIFGDDHIIHAEFINEPSHYGQDKPGHTIADWHRDMYLALKDFLTLENLYFDNHSEYTYAHFVGSKCPKCGKRFDFIGGPKRRVQIIQHGFSIPENLETGNFDHYLTSGWTPPSGFWLGGDGGAGELKHLAKGHALYMPHDGDYKMIWRQGNPAQTYNLYYKAFLSAMRKGKKVGAQPAHFETLQATAREWPMKEDFSADRIRWARLEAVRDALLKARE